MKGVLCRNHLLGSIASIDIVAPNQDVYANSILQKISYYELVYFEQNVLSQLSNQYKSMVQTYLKIQIF